MSEKDREILEDSFTAAIRQKDINAVKHFLNTGTSINATDINGYTPLHVAVETANLEILSFLLEQPEVNINPLSTAQETPLLLSTEASLSQCALMLLAHGADPTIPNYYGYTPLHFSVKRSYHVSLELLKKGADPDAVNFKMDTPLHFAAEDSNFEMISMLVYYGASADVANSDGFSPFMASLFKRADRKVQELLMEYEVDYNRIACDDISTICLAFLSKSPLCLELIQRGADVNNVHPPYNCIQLSFDSKELLKVVWDKFDLNNAYVYNSFFGVETPVECLLHSILHAETEPDLWLTHMQTILFSEKGLEMLLTLPLTIGDVYMPFRAFISVIVALEIPKEEVYKFLCVWLWCGVNFVHIAEINTLYNTYGCDDMLELLVHMNVVKDNYCNDLTLLHLICDVSIDDSIYDKIVLAHLSPRKQNMRECYRLFEYVTPSQKNRELFYDYREIFEIEFPEWGKNIATMLKCLPTVPSLMELSRNSARKEIIKKFRIDKCSMLFCVVNWLLIPDGIKSLLLYKLPVNRLCVTM